MTAQAVQLADHPFERWESSSGWEACIRMVGTGPCGRSEDEHVPAEEQTGG